MDAAQALDALAEQAERYRDAQKALDQERSATIEAIVSALQAGARPTDVDRRSPFTPAYNRQKAREAGIKPPTRRRVGA